MSTRGRGRLARDVLASPHMERERESGAGRRQHDFKSQRLDGTPHALAEVLSQAQHRALDAFFARATGDDPTDGEVRTVPGVASAVPEGERRLMLALIQGALRDAQQLWPTQRRADARAWLDDASALFSARVCFEAQGIDYDAARARLRRVWERGEAINGARTYAAGSRAKVGTRRRKDRR